MNIEINKDNFHKLDVIFNMEDINNELSLCLSITSDDLLEIINIYKSKNYFYRICELIIYHPNANNIILHSIFNISDKYPSLLNDLAACKNCPLDILEKLETHQSSSISEHAKINILARTIETIGDAEIIKLLNKHAKDNCFDVGIRSVIARSNKTSENILNILVNDDIDCISSIAKNNLLSRS